MLTAALFLFCFEICLFQLENDYSIVVVFVIYQYESAVGAHTCPPPSLKCYLH